MTAFKFCSQFLGLVLIMLQATQPRGIPFIVQHFVQHTPGWRKENLSRASFLVWENIAKSRWKITNPSSEMSDLLLISLIWCTCLWGDWWNSCNSSYSVLLCLSLQCWQGVPSVVSVMNLQSSNGQPVHWAVLLGKKGKYGVDITCTSM